jgi:hypothetical protein
VGTRRRLDGAELRDGAAIDGDHHALAVACSSYLRRDLGP